MLNAHDKLTIRIIDDQVKELNKRHTADAEMLSILSDFVPDVGFILKAAGIKEMKEQRKKWPLFAYFADLTVGRRPRKKQ